MAPPLKSATSCASSQVVSGRGEATLLDEDRKVVCKGGKVMLSAESCSMKAAAGERQSGRSCENPRVLGRHHVERRGRERRRQARLREAAEGGEVRCRAKEEPTGRSLELQTRRVGLQRISNESDGGVHNFKAPRVEENQRIERRRKEEEEGRGWEEEEKKPRAREDGESRSRFVLEYPESSVEERMQSDETVGKKSEGEVVKGNADCGELVC